MHMKDESLLKAAGWTLECDSPFEVRHRDGSFASGQAARLVMEAVRTESKMLSPCSDESRKPLKEVIEQLEATIRCLVGVREEARKTNTEAAWEIAYALTFSDAGSKSIKTLLTRLNLQFTWDDPDGGYDDDVNSYVDALVSFYEMAAPMLHGFKAIP